MNRSDLGELDRLAARLPFALDDAARVAGVFKRYVRKGRTADRDTLQIWVYCYVRRYFLVRFARHSSLREAEFEEAIEKAYRAVFRGLETVNDSARFPHWVSVICRNTFINLVSRRKPIISVDLVAEPQASGRAPSEGMDRTVVFECLAAAIDRLPEFLGVVARMHLLEQLEYAVISDRLDKSIPTVRAYMHRALGRIREDPVLGRVLGTHLEETHEK